MFEKEVSIFLAKINKANPNRRGASLVEKAKRVNIKNRYRKYQLPNRSLV